MNQAPTENLTPKNHKSALNEEGASDDTVKTKHHIWTAASGTKWETLEEADPLKNPINHIQKTY